MNLYNVSTVAHRKRKIIKKRVVIKKHDTSDVEMDDNTPPDPPIALKLSEIVADAIAVKQEKQTRDLEKEKKSLDRARPKLVKIIIERMTSVSKKGLNYCNFVYTNSIWKPQSFHRLVNTNDLLLIQMLQDKGFICAYVYSNQKDCYLLHVRLPYVNHA